MSTRKKIGLSVISVIACFILLFSISLLILDPEKQKLTDEERQNSSGEFVKLSAGITHYQTIGNDSAKTVILIHGFSVPYYIWDGTYEYLAQQGFHVIRYDLYGRGYSDRPYVIYDETFFRNQLLELFNTLKLKAPVSLAGVSFGGAVLTDFAVHYPELIDRIILIDPVYDFKKIKAYKQLANIQMAFQSDKTAKGQLEDFKYPEHFPDWVNKYKEQMQFSGFRNAILSTRFDYNGIAIKQNYKKLNELHKKVLLIWGKEDKTVTFNYSDSIRNILQTDFFPVNDAGHLPHLEQPSSVNAKMATFLKE